jgi:hypothetical protein
MGGSFVASNTDDDVSKSNGCGAENLNGPKGGFAYGMDVKAKNL